MKPVFPHDCPTERRESMRKTLCVAFVVAVVSLAAGCGGGPVETVDVVVDDGSGSPPAGVQEGAAPALELVEVAADGTEFDPPVQPEQIPEGAWYCDMGTVHYARLERGDGKCARCGMNLVHQVADPTAAGDS
jgi:hypothetical protein